MLKTSKRLRNPSLSRWFRSSAARESQTFREAVKVAPRPPATFKYREENKTTKESKQDAQRPRHAKRNPLGVQLLSRSLHEQIFKNCSFPVSPKAYTNISLEHLATHGLDPSQSSTLPSTEFTLPPLQGKNLLEHFHRIGAHSSEPYITLAQQFAEADVPPVPENWDIQAGWTKYYHRSDGSDYTEHVPYPMHGGQPEQLISFDVETMPKYHPYAILACAVTPNAWYVWISPWILDPSTASPEQLISLGPPDVPRVVVGHNVSYDRARILEEYHLSGTKTRFIDTMSLHVAIKGISSHQRPTWMKYRKKKQEEQDKRDEAVEAIYLLLQDVKKQLQGLRQAINSGLVADEGQEQKLLDLQMNLEESFPVLNSTQILPEDDLSELSALDEDTLVETVKKRWEDLSSANGLLDVAKLHCDIDISKEVRSDFMTSTPAEILEGIADYIAYCASDVKVTHQVFKKVLPGFLAACPHPVSFAGVINMGSGFLPVNEQWDVYLEKAEAVWNKLERKVRSGLEGLARAALESYKVISPEEVQGTWKDDVWLSQLDWSPKVAGKTRGIFPADVADQEDGTTSETPADSNVESASAALPLWYATVIADPLSKKCMERILPLLLRLSFDSHPMRFTPKEKWHYLPSSDSDDVARLPTSKKGLKTSAVLSKLHALPLLQDGRLTSSDVDLAQRISRGDAEEDVKQAVLKLAEAALEQDASTRQSDPWLSQLDWAEAESGDEESDGTTKRKASKKAKPKAEKPPPVYWPKWYWDLTKPKKGMPPGSLDLTIRNRYSPLLLKMSWHGYPLFHSREHGWIFRVPFSTEDATGTGAAAQESFKRLTPLCFYDPEDEKLADASLHGGYVFYKLPHKDGEKANVGNPLAKAFMKFAQDGVLKSSAGDELKELVDVGAKCSYWISARDRILNQLVGWEDKAGKGWDMGFPKPPTEATNDKINADDLSVEVSGGNSVAEEPTPKKWGMILPQVITMGTVTRRAIEKTWLTASNAKKNRVGSELKAMVRAPPGYAIVGADVDSEELWISSCMGDAQFGMHGATAIGWMTLEGTKSAGTDLHSKTAGILGITRDQAKVFNYSRIYGAGMRHAILLLQQGNSKMTPEEAHKLAGDLYASTKGKNTHRTDIFERKFWFGGTESFLFNKLEEIALSEKPQTPALNCGITHALSKEFLSTEFGSDYMPSRINWVVQSSGVDYLHLLIVSMDYLINKYDIGARYLISVHDELRYLVKEEDKYRTALALQIANLWTRCMFAYKLGMDDLPEGVAFFSAVDIDHVLRKEVDMPCITPSQLIPIPPGESLGIRDVLSRTNNGSLWKDGRKMETFNPPRNWVGSFKGYVERDCLVHRAANAAFLRAQATKDFGEIKHLAKKVYGRKIEGDLGDAKPKGGKKRAPVGTGEGVDWTETVERLLQSGRELIQ